MLLLLLLRTTGGAPALAMFANPIQQGALKPDVVSKPFRLYPFVPEDLFTFGEKLLVKGGLLYEVTGWLGLFCGWRHGNHGEAG